MELNQRKSEYLHLLDKAKQLTYSPVPSSLWSYTEKQIARGLTRHHGTKWFKIAEDMKSKTPNMVWKSLYLILDLLLTDVILDQGVLREKSCPRR